MNARCQRCVPAFNVPVCTRFFMFLCALGTMAGVLTIYRELVGLGPASGMNDAYAWGIWKTINTMVLTAVGSGAFSIGIAVWVFRRERLHAVMRTALLTSFLAYAFGLLLSAIDVGRPWNFYWILLPWNWNAHSPLLEVAVCMSFYALLPLTLENAPPLLEYLRARKPAWRETVEIAEARLASFYPFVIALAYVLPAMHQSSLGALMLLAGSRVNPLWQTPLLPLLYVWAAAYMGFAFVALTLLLAALFWGRATDRAVLAEMNVITVKLVASWTLLRFADLAVRGRLHYAFSDSYSLLFWLETTLLLAGLFVLRSTADTGNLSRTFRGYVMVTLGGMLYRFTPTTLAFQPRAQAFYFPSAIELLISIGFMALAAAVFTVAAKKLAILPAPISTWRSMEEAARVRRGRPTQYATEIDALS
jgi:Ni/Fe-hydrogenase subunit HybB-like protein